MDIEIIKTVTDSYHLYDGDRYLADCGKGVEGEERATAVWDEIMNLQVANSELLAERDRLQEALRGIVHFYRHGYSQKAVWEFVKHDPTHPAWLAYMEAGTNGVARWSYEAAELALDGEET